MRTGDHMPGAAGTAPVLIIAEDDAGFARLLRDEAVARGWSVTLCADGAELIAVLPGVTDPALVLIDIVMPVVDGIEAIQRLPDRLPGAARMRFRFMTGGGQVSVMTAQMFADARDLEVGRTLFKPIRLRAFSDELERERVILAEPRHV